MKENSRIAITDIIQKCLDGDDASWHELVDLVAPTIFSICRKSRLSRDESFDIFGQVSLQLLNNLASLRDPKKILSFVGTITRRQIYNFYQKMKLIDSTDDQGVELLPDMIRPDPENRYQATRDREILLEAMLTLSERDYKLIKMLFLDPDEPSYVEIGRKLKMPVSSIGPIRAKALARLYQKLKSKRFKI